MAELDDRDVTLRVAEALEMLGLESDRTMWLEFWQSMEEDDQDYYEG